MAKTHQRGLWPVRRRILTAGGRKRKRNTTRKRRGWAKISPTGCIERVSQFSISSSTTKSAPSVRGREYLHGSPQLVSVWMLTADNRISHQLIDSMVSVGTIIADGSHFGGLARSAATRTPLKPWDTRSPRCVGDWCGVERCSPWPAPFSPQTPPRIALLCSSGSSIVWRGPTPLERARPPCGFGPSRTGLVPVWAEALQRSPDLVPVVPQRARVLRLRRTDCSLAIIAKQPCCLPPIRRESASWFCVFRSSIARPTDTPVYASSDISRCLLQD